MKVSLAEMILYCGYILTASIASAQEESSSTHSSAELTPSFWASNCQAPLTAQINQLQDNFGKNKSEYGKANNQTKAQMLLLDVYKNAAYNFAKKYPPGAKFPEFIEEEAGDSRQIVQAYNAFASESSKFMSSLKPGAPGYGQLSKCHSAPHTLGTDQGAFAKQIETTKRFMMFRRFFAQMAAKEIGIKRGTDAQAGGLQSEVGRLFSEKINVAQSEMKSCPLNVWAKSKEHFLHRPQKVAANSKSACTDNDLTEFKALFSDSFTKVATSIDGPPRSATASLEEPSAAK